MSDRFDLSLAASGEIAIADDDGTLTFAELAERARAFRVEPGERVLFVPGIDRASVITFFALLDRRAQIVLAHPRWSRAELERAIALSDPALVIYDGRFERRSARLPREHDVQLVVFTSGSEGRPKGACLSRAALLAAAEAHAKALPWRPGDRWHLAMPLAHIGGASLALRCLAARRAIVLGAPMLDACERHGATLLSIVPTMLARVLPAPPPRDLRAVLIGGAACSAALLAEGRAAGWPLLPTYGLSELGGQVCTQRLDGPQSHGVGPPLPGVELRIVDGMIEVRGPAMMRGYLGEGPHHDWLRTGDLGRIDDGYLHVLGRADDRIVSGGENVDPIEVEDALSAHPSVAACLVHGAPDPIWGATVCALVVPRGEPPSITQLRAHLETRLAGFKHPRRWRFVAALPLTPSGKPDRRQSTEET